MPVIFHMPLVSLINKKMMKLCNLAEGTKQMQENKEDILVLFTDPHPFKSEIYMSVEGKIPNAKNVNLSGKYVSKVFDGPYNAIPKFFKEMDSYLAAKGQKAKKYYVHYSYCPKCAEKFGHNYMAFFAEV